MTTSPVLLFCTDVSTTLKYSDGADSIVPMMSVRKLSRLTVVSLSGTTFRQDFSGLESLQWCMRAIFVTTDCVCE